MGIIFVNHEVRITFLNNQYFIWKVSEGLNCVAQFIRGSWSFDPQKKGCQCNALERAHKWVILSTLHPVGSLTSPGMILQVTVTVFSIV